MSADIVNLKISEAAAWLSRQSPTPSPIVPALRSRFGLTVLEACEAIRAATSGGAR